MAKLTIPHDDPKFNGGGGGLKATVSFQRLESMLRSIGELKPNESISGFVVNEYGIQYTIIK